MPYDLNQVLPYVAYNLAQPTNGASLALLQAMGGVPAARPAPYDPMADYVPSYGSSPYGLDPAVYDYNQRMYNLYGGPEAYRFNDMYTPGMASGPDLRNDWNSLPATDEPMRYGPPQGADYPEIPWEPYR